jgi:hypothetical protein
MNRLANNKGSALLIVLIALLLVTSLYAAVILYGSYHRRLAIREVADTRAFYLAESGIEAALSRLNQESEYKFVLSEKIGNSGGYEVDVKPFGAYLLCTSTGTSGIRARTLRYLIGMKPENKFSNAVNLGGQDYPLTLAGRTTIIGDVLVSPAGVLPGRFKGRRYGGEKLVYGEIIQSAFDRLPEYSDTIINAFKSDIERLTFGKGMVFDRTFILNENTLPDIQDDSLIQFNSDLIIELEEKAFDLTDKYFLVRGNLQVSNSSRLYGFGIIKATGDVIFDNDCYLKDMIIMSDKDILFKGNSVFAGQLLAGGKVEITQTASLDCQAVVIATGELTDEDRGIYFSSSQKSQGIILCDLKLGQTNRPGQRMYKSIDLADGSDFSGLIYNTGCSRVSGSLSGCLSTASLYIYDAPTVYINWLVDAIVASENIYEIIPAAFTGSGIYAKVGRL